VVKMVSHDRHCLIQQIRNLSLALALKGLLQQIDVVAPAGLDENLARGGSLCLSVTCYLVLLPEPGFGCSYIVLLLVRHGDPVSGSGRVAQELEKPGRRCRVEGDEGHDCLRVVATKCS
jgi:hypothetical protein